MENNEVQNILKEIQKSVQQALEKLKSVEAKLDRLKHEEIFYIEKKVDEIKSKIVK